MALLMAVGGTSLHHCTSPRRMFSPLSSISDIHNPILWNPGVSRLGCYSWRPLRSSPSATLRFGRMSTTDADGTSGECFFEAIEELERMVRDPSDILTEMTERLSSRELQLVLVYFAEEGRDSYCALDVFDWLRKENRVDGETMELMVSIACGWIQRIIGGDHDVNDVVGLLNEMDCVGLEPGFNMLEKVVSLYWERGKKEEAVVFVKDVMRRRRLGAFAVHDTGENERGGPVGYLAWKMVLDGNYMGAVKMVIEIKEKGLKPEVYCYLIALTALVKEQKELSKALRWLKSSIKANKIDTLDEDNSAHIHRYQLELISASIKLSEWAIQEGSSRVALVAHEKLLAIYTSAGFGLEAEQQLWQLKLLGKEPDRELYDAVLATCASQNEVRAVQRLLVGIEFRSVEHRKKSFSWLLRGYLKGGYYLDASETLLRMIDLGLYPEYIDRAAVLQGLRKIVKEYGNIEPYLKLCKRLSDVDLIGPCLVYMYINRYKIWTITTL